MSQVILLLFIIEERVIFNIIKNGIAVGMCIQITFQLSRITEFQHQIHPNYKRGTIWIF